MHLTFSVKISEINIFYSRAVTFQQEGSYFPLTRNVHNQNFIDHNKTIQKKDNLYKYES